MRSEADQGDYDNALAEVYGGDRTEQEGNARLIAAAPDLLAACKLFAEWDALHKHLSVPSDVAEAVNAAIAKATGAVEQTRRVAGCGDDTNVEVR